MSDKTVHLSWMCLLYAYISNEQQLFCRSVVYLLRPAYMKVWTRAVLSCAVSADVSLETESFPSPDKQILQSDHCDRPLRVSLQAKVTISRLDITYELHGESRFPIRERWKVPKQTNS